MDSDSNQTKLKINDMSRPEVVAVMSNPYLNDFEYSVLYTSGPTEEVIVRGGVTKDTPLARLRRAESHEFFCGSEYEVIHIQYMVLKPDMKVYTTDGRELNRFTRNRELGPNEYLNVKRKGFWPSMGQPVVAEIVGLLQGPVDESKFKARQPDRVREVLSKSDIKVTIPMERGKNSRTVETNDGAVEGTSAEDTKVMAPDPSDMPGLEGDDGEPISKPKGRKYETTVMSTDKREGENEQHPRVDSSAGEIVDGKELVVKEETAGRDLISFSPPKVKGGDNKRENDGNENPNDANPSDNGEETASTNRDGIARVVEDEDASEIRMG